MSRHNRTLFAISLSTLVFLALQGVHAAKSPETESKFLVPSECRVSINDKKHATLADLKAGMKVHVRYQNRDGILQAEAIVEAKPPKPPIDEPNKNPNPTPKPQKPPRPSNELHANGVIQNIDLGANAVTILGRIHPQKQQP